jgi:chemotaxis protein MotB
MAIRQATPPALRENVTMTLTSEGLRVELIEGQGSLFFESGSPAPTTAGKDLLASLAGELGKLPNKITIEGHTDSQPIAGREGYSNWELSADRANAARRLMESMGVRDDQVIQVRGYADRSPRNPGDPNDPSNRRVTLIVQNQQAEPAPRSSTP